VINQSIAVWRAGTSFDPIGNGRTALKSSYSTTRSGVVFFVL